jgi:hypothetical protein
MLLTLRPAVSRSRSQAPDGVFYTTTVNQEAYDSYGIDVRIQELLDLGFILVSSQNADTVSAKPGRYI